jgi:putative ABC transport system substrate-binding protein
LLKEISLAMSRTGVLRDPALTTSIGQFAAIQSAAPSLGVELIPLNARNAGDIERTITAFVRLPKAG